MERIGVGFSGGLQPSEVVECVSYAEELGYESAWVTEGHGGDQFTILTACALATSRIKLGTSISSVFARSAPTIAIAAACVDEFSKGRFILGLGSSHRVQVVGEHGLAYGKPLTRVRESVEIIRALLRGGQVSYQGDIFNIEGYDLWFTPFRREIPVYLGAVNPRMLELCGQTAQGVILTRSTVEQARAAIGHVSAGALGVGRDPSEVELALQLACSVSDNKEEARDRIRGRVAMYAARFPRYRGVMEDAGFTEEVEAIRQAWDRGSHAQAQSLVPDELIDSMSLVGTPDECREGIQKYRDAGITLPIIMPSVDKEGAVEQARETIRACAPQ